MVAMSAYVIRKTGARQPNGHLDLTPSEQARAIHQAYCDGESARSISRRLGKNETWVWEQIKRVHRANREAVIDRVARRVLP